MSWNISYCSHEMFLGEVWRNIGGSYHRVGGPAFELNGRKSWWLEGINYSFGEYVNKLFPEDSPERTAFLLKWSGS